MHQMHRAGWDRSTLYGQRSMRRNRRGMSQPVFVCELLSDPMIVVFFSPVEIDLAGTHGLECTLHSDRADIDVGQDQGDEQNGHDGM